MFQESYCGCLPHPGPAKKEKCKVSAPRPIDLNGRTKINHRMMSPKRSAALTVAGSSHLDPKHTVSAG